MENIEELLKRGSGEDRKTSKEKGSFRRGRSGENCEEGNGGDTKWRRGTEERQIWRKGGNERNGLWRRKLVEGELPTPTLCQSKNTPN